MRRGRQSTAENQELEPCLGTVKCELGDRTANVQLHALLSIVIRHGGALYCRCTSSQSREKLHEVPTLSTVCTDYSSPQIPSVVVLVIGHLQ